jgi:hypothetical protein
MQGSTYGLGREHAARALPEEPEYFDFENFLVEF